MSYAQVLLIAELGFHHAEIGHEKAQSVIDSITSSYAAEGQAHANPMLPQNQPGNGFPPPFPFPGMTYYTSFTLESPAAQAARTSYLSNHVTSRVRISTAQQIYLLTYLS